MSKHTNNKSAVVLSAHLGPFHPLRSFVTDLLLSSFFCFFLWRVQARNLTLRTRSLCWSESHATNIIVRILKSYLRTYYWNYFSPLSSSHLSHPHTKGSINKKHVKFKRNVFTINFLWISLFIVLQKTSSLFLPFSVRPSARCSLHAWDMSDLKRNPRWKKGEKLFLWGVERSAVLSCQASRAEQYIKCFHLISLQSLFIVVVSIKLCFFDERRKNELKCYYCWFFTAVEQ